MLLEGHFCSIREKNTGYDDMYIMKCVYGGGDLLCVPHNMTKQMQRERSIYRGGVGERGEFVFTKRNRER